MGHTVEEGNSTYEIYYEFAPPMKVTSLQEYLIFDMVGMIGSVGGTLGMCIGFSFSGITTNLLNFMERRFTKNQ